MNMRRLASLGHWVAATAAVLLHAHAAAQAADQLIITNTDGSTFYSRATGIAPAGAIQAPLGALRLALPGGLVLGFDWTSIDASAWFPSLGAPGSGTYDSTALQAWWSTLPGQVSELFLLQPGGTNVVSDVVLRFSTNSAGVSTDAVLMFTDPRLVAAIVGLPRLPGYSQVAETGAPQDVTAFLYPTGVPSPFRSIEVVSAIPELSTIVLLVAGLAVLGIVRGRRAA